MLYNISSLATELCQSLNPQTPAFSTSPSPESEQLTIPFQTHYPVPTYTITHSHLKMVNTGYKRYKDMKKDDHSNDLLKETGGNKCYLPITS